MNPASALPSDVSAIVKCPLCESHLSSKALARHMLSHSSRIGTNRHGKYQCAWPRCGKLIYGHNNNLVEHYYTHTDARPFGCADCGLLSNSKSSILRHVKRWHPGKYDQIKTKAFRAWIPRADAERLSAARDKPNFDGPADEAVQLYTMDNFVTPPGTVVQDLPQLSPAPVMGPRVHETDVSPPGYFGVSFGKPPTPEIPLDAGLDLFLPNSYGPGAAPFSHGWSAPPNPGSLFAQDGEKPDYLATAGSDLGYFPAMDSGAGTHSHAYPAGPQDTNALAFSGGAWRSGALPPTISGASASATPASHSQATQSLTDVLTWGLSTHGADWHGSAYHGFDVKY